MFIGPLLPLLLAAAPALVSAHKAQNNNAPIVLDGPPIFSILTCPTFCPCCEGCEWLPHCDGVDSSVTYNTIRNIAGCESLPLDTPLCPIGDCSPKCLCREELMQQVKDALSNSRDYDYDRKVDKGDGMVKEESLLMLKQTFPYKLQPWYLQMPECPCWCKHCPNCVPPNVIAPPYLTFREVRHVVGCDTMPATIPLCPIERCREDCVCREVFLKRLEEALFRRPEKETADQQYMTDNFQTELR